MLDEGCTPNLVTFNTLIDLYVKTGQWQEAIGVLDTLEEHVGGGRRGLRGAGSGTRAFRHGCFRPAAIETRVQRRSAR
jgi:pentatricopeptide repeat protein